MSDPAIMTPLDHLLATLNNPLVGQARKDKVAESLLPYLHPRLSATAMISAGGKGGNNNGTRGIDGPYALPRGSSISPNGEITFPPDAVLERVEPFKPTHDWTTTALTDQREQPEPVIERPEVVVETTPEPEPLPVIDEEPAAPPPVRTMDPAPNVTKLRPHERTYSEGAHHDRSRRPAAMNPFQHKPRGPFDAA